MARAGFAIFVGLLCAACVSAPDLKRAPRIEMRFGEKPKTEAKPAQKPKPIAPEPEKKEAPDPPAKSSNRQLVFHLKMDHQVLTLSRVEGRELGEARVTPRRYGRFAIEAFRGDELVERLRFDFPLLGDTRSALDDVEPGLVTSTEVEFPELEGVTRLLVVDRKSRKIVELPLLASDGALVSSATGGASSSATGGASSSATGGASSWQVGGPSETSNSGGAKPVEPSKAAGPSSAGGAASTHKPSK